MTARTTLHLHFDASDISRDFKPPSGEGPGYAALDIGQGPVAATLFFESIAAVDAAIRELAALKSKMLTARTIAGDFDPEITEGGAL